MGKIFRQNLEIKLTKKEKKYQISMLNELKKGNLSLLLNLIIFSFVTVFIVAGADGFLKQDPENLNKIFTNPCLLYTSPSPRD